MALLYKQWNLATMLIQKDGDMNQLIYQEDLARQERIWKREELKRKRERREEERNQIMSSSLAEPSAPDSDEETDEELDRWAEQDRQPLPSRSIFKLSIESDQHTLAYLTLGSYENTKAIQDAMECKQFNLIYKILDKIPANRKLSSVVNKDSQNLFQTLFKNFDHNYFSDDKKLLEFIDMLKRRGVDLEVKDAKGQQIMHYVCESQSGRLIKLLREHFEFDVNERDNEQNTPFFLYFKKLQMSHDVQRMKTDEIFYKMVKEYGADLNALYPYGDAFRSIKETDGEEDQFLERMIDLKHCPEKAPDPEKQAAKPTSYMCPLVFYYVLRESQRRAFEQRYDAIRHLVDLGANFTSRDSEGRDVFMLSVMRNNTKIFEFVVSLSEKAGINLDAVDNEGKSAAHYVVNPLIRGSYENEKLLKLLKEAKFNMTIEDRDGMTPADYAGLQHTQKLLKAFQKLKILTAEDVKEETSAAPASALQQEDQKMEDEDESQIVEKKEEEPAEPSGKVEAEEDRMKALTLQANKYVPPCTVPFERHAAAYIKENEDKFKIALQTEEELQDHDLYDGWFLGR